MRAGLFVVVAIYVASSLFGIAAPLLWGHHGYHGATYMLRAIMTLRFHIVTPSNWAGYEYPPRFSWYFHHPIGYHHLLVPWVALFGAKEWVGARLRSDGRAVHDLGPLRAGEAPLVAPGGALRHGGLRDHAVHHPVRGAARPHAADHGADAGGARRVPPLPGAAGAQVADWRLRGLRGRRIDDVDGYFEAFFLGVVSMVTLTTRAGRQARLLADGKPTRWNAPLTWTMWTGMMSALTMAFHFLFTWKVGMMADFRSSYNQRHAAGFDYVYGKEQEWAQLLFGKPLLIAGALWLVVFMARAAAGRARWRDVAVWIFLVNKTFYVYLFREAAAVHEYRVDWYLVFLTLAVVDLACDFGGFVAFLVERRPRAASVAGAAASLLAAAGFLYFQVPLGYRKLITAARPWAPTWAATTPTIRGSCSRRRWRGAPARRTSSSP